LTWLTLLVEVELTFETPVTGLTASSIGLVTSVSIVAGLAPGYVVMMNAPGIVSEGISS
jgi:Sec-independent protein secretion pathway component TatC